MKDQPTRSTQGRHGRSPLRFPAIAAFLALAAIFPGAAPETSAQNQNPPDRLPAAMQAMPAAAGKRDVLQAQTRQFAQSGATAYCVALVEFTTPAAREALKAPGVTVYSAFQQFADVFIPATYQGKDIACDEGAAKAIESAPGFLYGDIARKVEVEPPPSLERGERTRAEPERIVRGGIADLKGKGVIVAIFDSGVDFRNPDFVTYDAGGRPTSRILYLWDTSSDAYDKQKLGSKAPVSFPNGASVGTLYTQEQLTAELRAGTVRIPATDQHGHGTGVAGVAVGNGNNAKDKGRQYAGVAPEADMIVVKMGAKQGYENTYLLNAAVGWADQVAKRAGEPLVINCSWGGMSGAHDGNTLMERQLNARFADTVKGRAIVIAAGNDQTKGFHARKKISTREQASLLVWSAGKDGGGLLLFVRNADGTPFEGSDLMIEGGSTADGKPLDLTKRWMGATPVANDHVTVLPVPGGASRLFLWNKAGKEAYVDAYVVGENATFVLLYQSPANTVSEPAMARQAITVGSYDWNDQFHFRGEPLTLSPVCGGLMHIGELSCYSSLGPGRDPDTLKPDIAAPGEWYSSSAAKTPDGKSIMAPENGWVPDSSGNYILFNGTSSAAPYTSGIVALMLQKKPGLTVGEVRTLLHKYATQDAFTGAVPNANWGYGKLDMAAVQAILSHL